MSDTSTDGRERYRAEPFWYDSAPLDPDEDPDEPYLWEIQKGRKSDSGRWHWKPTGESFEDESEAKSRVEELNGGGCSLQPDSGTP